MIVLGMVILTSLAFDFTNGFHDTANAMATSIATGALKPKTAVALSAVLNLVGAFLSVQVALTVTNSVTRTQDSSGAPNPQLTADGGAHCFSSCSKAWWVPFSGTFSPGCWACRAPPRMPFS